jgi:hypothetical protein
MTRRRLFLAFSALLLVAPVLRAEAPPAATPESACRPSAFSGSGP